MNAPASETLCHFCRRPKKVSPCDVCTEQACQDCSQYLDETTFSFFKTTPPELLHSRYCQNCYSQHVEPALETYNEIMTRAKELYVFFKTQKVKPPLIRKAKEKILVKECVDRDETILRLGFLAAEQGFNSLIETEVTAEKVRNAGYQKSKWSGEAVPAEVNHAKLTRFLGE